MNGSEKTNESLHPNLDRRTAPCQAAVVTEVCAAAIIDAMVRKGTKHQILSAEAVELVANRFRILGEPVRIRVLQALQGGRKNVTELVATVGSTQPNVSKHLRILQDSGIVGREQVGNNVFYFIADESVLDLCDAVCGSISDHLAQGARLAEELGKGVRRK